MDQTPLNIFSFSIDTVITEFKSNAPDVYQLMMILGKTHRNQTPEDDSIKTEQHRMIMSMCTFLKAAIKSYAYSKSNESTGNAPLITTNFPQWYNTTLLYAHM